MQTKKMSLANIQGKLSRAEMKNIMAGSGGFNVTCICGDGTRVSIKDCDVCIKYCSNKKGQGKGSDCLE